MAAAALAVVLGLSLFAPPAAAAGRVVTLLQNLKAKLEEDAKAEEDVYEKFECWAKTVIDSKKAANVAAASRIDSLEAYIADIDAGRIEFTTERADLQLQEKELVRDLEKAKAMRESEKKDFEAAKEEMEQAIAALEEAIKTLKEGTAA